MSDRCLGDPLYFSFADFVLYHARDIVGIFDHDAPLPEVVEPSLYHAELAAAAASKLAEVEAWDEATADGKPRLLTIRRCKLIGVRLWLRPRAG